MWIRSEDRAELVGQGVRLRRELAPGDAHDPIAPEGELIVGRGSAYLSAKSRNAVSKSLRMTVSPCWRWISRARLRAWVPLRRGCRAIRASRVSGLQRRRISASLRACSSYWAVTTAARSKRVRAGLVTGITSW